MKRILIILSGAALISVQAVAQIPGTRAVTSLIPKVMFGIKAGANFSELSSSGTWTQSYEGGFTGGFFLGLHGKRFGFQPEALVHTAKFVSKLDASAYTATVNLDVPLLLEYKIIPRIWIQLGPQFSDILSKSDYGGISSNFSTIDYSGVVGAQAILPLHLVLGARYILGFAEQNNDKSAVTGVNESWKNRAFQMYLGLRFL
jgi:Outer membrane protein beta-barrel domain